MLEFTFPETLSVNRGSLNSFVTNANGFVNFSPMDPLQPMQNIITIDNIDYVVLPLNDSGGNKGGNSIILRLYGLEGFDVDSPEYGVPNLIIKILKYPKSKSGKFLKNSEIRFRQEILSLVACKANDFENIINIHSDGICKIFNAIKKETNQYLFYTMEYAQFDLRDYISNNFDLDINEKLSLCISLANGLDELHSLGYYHRDIKPDNIFMVNDNWKIGDLGLLAERNDEIDGKGDWIGPRGWMSPESMNKHLCEGNDFEGGFNCSIDEQSDIFQLGKVFWFIMQGNAPIGCVSISDFHPKNINLFAVIRTMLNHSCVKRYSSVEEVVRLLKRIEQRLLKRNLVA